MEMFGLIIGLVIVVWFFGFHRSARSLADMANAEVDMLKTQQKVRHVTNMVNVKISQEDFQKAVANKAMLDEFHL